MKKINRSGPFDIILILLAITIVLTYIIPSGEYVRVSGELDPNSFHYIDKIFLNPIDVLFKMPVHAYNKMGALFITMMIMGGTIRVIQDTKTFDIGVYVLVRKFGDKSLFLIPLLFALTGFLGSVSVMISTAIAFVPLGLTISKHLKVDNIFAVALMFLGSYTGFMTSPISPVTTAIAQELVGIKVFSGFEFRLILTVVLVGVAAFYLTCYAYKVRKNIKNSVMDEVTIDEVTANDEDISDKKFTYLNTIIFLIFLGGFLIFSYGSAYWNYRVSHLGAIMIAVGVACGLIGGMKSYDLSLSFIKGAQGMMMPIIFMIISGGIAVSLESGQILDTIVYYSAIPLSSFGPYFAAIGMFISNSIINLVIPSGSGQAVVVMPIMGPLSELCGITKQTAVLAYQMGDGFTNLLNPTNAILLGSLSIAGCSLKDWFKLVFPLYIIFFIILSLTLVLAVAIGWS